MDEKDPEVVQPRTRVPGILTRQDVEDRERLARRRPRWRRRPRRPLRDMNGGQATVLVLAPVVLLVDAVRLAAGLQGHGWIQLLAAPCAVAGAALIAVEVVYLRRPVDRR
ncbi:MAG TPA: hypothetical protein VFP72_18900 [Kineosporiaceae bacterium]|nr:hypothetical protein [Kineosporiaceae bacterium]